VIFDKLWKIVVSVAVAATLIGTVVYFATRETKRQMTPLMKDLAKAATSEFARELPRDRSVNTALFLVSGRGPRDEEDEFREMLTHAVEGTSKYRLETWDRITDQLDETLVGRFLTETGLAPGQSPQRMDQAIKVVTRLEHAGIAVDGILFVDVAEFTEGPDQDGLGARIKLDGSLYSLKEKKTTKAPTINHEIASALDPRYVSYRITQQTIIGRFLLWFVLACGLPWLCIGLVRKVVKTRRNELNGALLVGFTLVDLLLFWFLVLAMNFFGAGPLTGLLLTAALMGYYNYDAMDYIGRKLL
jgi:hypothetical protein